MFRWGRRFDEWTSSGQLLPSFGVCFFFLLLSEQYLLVPQWRWKNSIVQCSPLTSSSLLRSLRVCRNAGHAVKLLIRPRPLDFLCPIMQMTIVDPR